MLYMVHVHASKTKESLYLVTLHFVKNAVFLSILKRERERTVNVILQKFQTVYFVQYELFRPSNVPDFENAHETIENARGTFRNGERL